jgi:hypothetical protein
MKRGWLERVACAESPPEMFFPPPRLEGGKKYREIEESLMEAQQVCLSFCLVRDQCLKFSLDNDLFDGMYGGVLPLQRAVMKHPKGWCVAHSQPFTKLLSNEDKWDCPKCAYGVKLRKYARLSRQRRDLDPLTRPSPLGLCKRGHSWEVEGKQSATTGYWFCSACALENSRLTKTERRRRPEGVCLRHPNSPRIAGSRKGAICAYCAERREREKQSQLSKYR